MEVKTVHLLESLHAMEIHINSNTRIAELQSAFRTEFPHLKLGFFEDRNHDKKLTADELLKDERTTLSSIKGALSNGSLLIEGNMTVEELEFGFLRQFNLHVQVFRKSGGNWLATSSTDEWTLNEQELRGREMSSPVEAEEPEDYQEQE